MTEHTPTGDAYQQPARQHTPQPPNQDEGTDMAATTAPTACERLGHDDEVTYQDDESMIWACRRCGAEGWEDLDGDES